MRRTSAHTSTAVAGSERAPIDSCRGAQRERAVLTSCRARARSPLWLAVPAAVAISITGGTSALAGFIEATGCVGRWAMWSCVTVGKAPLGDTYVRHVPEAFGDAEKAAQAERDHRWVARCHPIIVQDGYGVPRYRYGAPGCEFGVNKD